MSIPNHICRCCLKSRPRVYLIGSVQVQTKPLAQLLHWIVPDLRLNLSAEPVICMPCYKSLREAYSFRLQCLQSEKMISIYMKETNTAYGNIRLHDVVEYCKGVFKPKSTDPCQSKTSLTNDVPELIESDDSNDGEGNCYSLLSDEPEPEHFEQYKKKSTSISPLATKEAQPKSDNCKAGLSKLDTAEKNIFVKPRLSYINEHLNYKPGTSENNNTTLSAQPELNTNRAHTVTSATLTAGKSTEDFISTSRIAPSCQKYLTKTGDIGFRIRNDLMNQAVNNTVANIMKDTGKKLERPKLHPVRRHRIITKVLEKQPSHQIAEDATISKETRVMVPVNTYSGPSAPKPTSDVSTLKQPPPAASPALPLETIPASKLLPAPHVPVNINYIPKNNKVDKEMLSVLQNSNMFKEHVRNHSGHETFLVRKILDKKNKLLGYSVDVEDGAEPESGGTRQKFVVQVDKGNTPLLTADDLETLHKTENNQESSKSETSSTEKISTTAMANPLTEVHPEILPETENNQESLGLFGKSSSEISAPAMPRIRVRPESSLKKIRTLNHELFPQHRDIFGFSQVQSPNQDPSFPKPPPLMELTKIHINPPVPLRSNQYPDGTKQTPFVLNSMVARQKVPSPHAELSNAPIIPGLVPVTKEHLKKMGIMGRIYIKRLPPSHTPASILPVDEEISIKEEPREYFNEEEYLRTIEKVNTFVQNDLDDGPSYTSTEVLPVDEEMSVGEESLAEEPLIAIKNEPIFVEDDIDIKEEPLSYDEDDVSLQRFEPIDSVFDEPTSDADENSLNDNLPEHDTDLNLSNESTLSGSETPMDTETLDGLLDIREIEEYDMPEYIHVKNVDSMELEELKKGANNPKKNMKFSDLAKPALSVSDKIPDLNVSTQRKRFRLVSVDDDDEPPKKKWIEKIRPVVRKKTPLDEMNENICTISTKFTSQGDYINDHDYFRSPYERYGLIEFATNRRRCLLCGHALPIDEHIRHMQCHSTYCRICKLDFNNVFVLNFHVRQHIYRCPDCHVNVTYARYAHHAETHNARTLSNLKKFNSVCDGTIPKSPTTAINRRSCTVTRAIEEDGKQPITATATNENQLQSKETSRAIPVFCDEKGFTSLSDLYESRNNTNVNTVETASPSSNLVTKKKRKPRSRKRRHRKNGQFAIMKNEVRDNTRMSADNLDKAAKRETPESNAVAESNIKISNTLQIKETNFEENNIKQATDTNVLPCNSVEGDVTTTPTSQRCTKYLRSSNTPSPSRINRLKEDFSTTKRYPTRKSVVGTDLNIPSSSIKSETSSNVADIISNNQSRSELVKSEPEKMSITSNNQPEEKCWNPFADPNLKKDIMEHISLSKKMLLENISVNESCGSDNTEDNMTVSEGESSTLDNIQSTEIARKTRTSRSSGNESYKTRTRRRRSSLATIQIAVNDALLHSEESISSIARKHSINVSTLRRNVLKARAGNKEHTQTNLDNAAQEVLNQGESVGTVAEKHFINPTTLHRYCENINKDNKGIGKEKGNQKQTKHRKRKSRKPVLLEDGSYDVDDALCLVCSGKYSKSLAGEEWIRCTKCHGWAHEKCVNADTYFVCQNCGLKDNVLTTITKDDVIQPTPL
ncbi:unnamed protein product [Ceutorhynchus assimilis]|uniref:ZAD domain-containing protein n=1 Tax=Ceutorhynchus assimilis TaxID=467358 RepID=A0A9N9QRI1_9CUCU|nr:unnamed protein product [Ceutorhynchus assimilis]